MPSAAAIDEKTCGGDTACALPPGHRVAAIKHAEPTSEARWIQRATFTKDHLPRVSRRAPDGSIPDSRVRFYAGERNLAIPTVELDGFRDLSGSARIVLNGHD